LQSKRASYPVITASLSNYKLVANQSCSGATTGEVIAQVGRLPAKLTGPNSPVRLVTLTVGGIDAGSNQVLAACTTGLTPADCLGTLTFATTQLQEGILVPSLRETYVAAARAMPNATIVVFTYPLLFHPNAARVFGAELVGAVNLTTTLLNANIERAAMLSGLGDRIEVVDVTEEFLPHGIGAEVPWISFDRINPDPRPNFHPNALGNSGYSQALMAADVLG